MNLILFSAEEIRAGTLPVGDARARHVLEILRRNPGDSFDAGQIDGPRGKATLLEICDRELKLGFAWSGEPPPLAPVTLIIGLPRPQTARKILTEASALGVSAMHFVLSEKGEPGYAQSTLWSSGEWRRLLIAGAEQAFCTRLPAVTWGATLQATLPGLAPDCCRLALDNYEAPEALGALTLSSGQVALALGSERGWSATERELLRAGGFRFAHLGSRVLRTETAVVAATTLVLAKLGRL